MGRAQGIGQSMQLSSVGLMSYGRSNSWGQALLWWLR